MPKVGGQGALETLRPGLADGVGGLVGAFHLEKWEAEADLIDVHRRG